MSPYQLMMVIMRCSHRLITQSAEGLKGKSGISFDSCINALWGERRKALNTAMENAEDDDEHAPL
ncbi:hypothetical protein AA15669_0810 [Saccharibacter floricola DSM 15669]|uniref:Uncharacterized protein n=1 Tax=Saccharibacter floricola DSM 15669 TaxID=1123227 RepID=A0ABQ0P1E8_9PROT|nr:hypothetical protein AA15669_0810 [Saccharibacter floricola DSM 15669]